MRLQIGGKLLITTHLNQWNYLLNKKYGVVHKYDLIVSVRLFLNSFKALKIVLFQGHNNCQVDLLKMPIVPYLRYPMHGHILNINED